VHINVELIMHGMYLYLNLNMHQKTIPEHQVKRFEYLKTLLHEYRINSNLRQEDLSQYSDLHRNTIVRIEQGKNLTLLSLFELADALQVSPRELFMDIE